MSESGHGLSETSIQTELESRDQAGEEMDVSESHVAAIEPVLAGHHSVEKLACFLNRLDGICVRRRVDGASKSGCLNSSDMGQDRG